MVYDNRITGISKIYYNKSLLAIAMLENRGIMDFVLRKWYKYNKFDKEV